MTRVDREHPVARSAEAAVRGLINTLIAHGHLNAGGVVEPGVRLTLDIDPDGSVGIGLAYRDLTPEDPAVRSRKATWTMKDHSEPSEAA